MIRPLVEASYDYRMNVAVETNLLNRNNYKGQYFEACAIIGADQISNQMQQDPNLKLSDAISQWNKRHDELVLGGHQEIKQNSQLQNDYKAKLDCIFRNNMKSHFRAVQTEPKSYDTYKQRIEYPQKRQMREAFTYSKRDHQNYNYQNQKYYQSASFHKTTENPYKNYQKHRNNDRH